MSITCKQPNAEPTEKQLAFFNTLMAERGLPTIEAFAEDCTRQGASDAIEAAKALPKQGKGEPKPTMDALAATLGVEATNYKPVTDAALGVDGEGDECKPSLMDLAAQITGQATPARMGQIAENYAAVKAATQSPAVNVPRPEFTDRELRELHSALSCYGCETDGTPISNDLYERIGAYLTVKGL